MHYDTIILGAGAAGLFCAGHLSGRVLIVDHAKKPGEKIRISGGGRCNFTNMYAAPENFISANPHFCKSALARYTQWDFIDLIAKHGIAYHEKTLGQLFCDNSAKDVIAMLLGMLGKNKLRLDISARKITQSGGQFQVALSDGSVTHADNLVVATGGKSIPKMGATGFGYDLARQFGLNVLDTRPGLVPLTFSADLLEGMKSLSGTALDAKTRSGNAQFAEALLFTHRGLSGPSILQISNYWKETQDIEVALLENALPKLKELRQSQGRRQISTALAELLPKRLAHWWADRNGLTGNIADFSDIRLKEVADGLENWRLRPTGSEGYRTAEVTLGGVDTDELNARSMEAKNVPGLYFIGEVVDVTGWLGGYNFQWAWSSAHAAAMAINSRSLS